MKRRTLLKAVGAVGLAAPFINARSQQVTTLRFHTFVPPRANLWVRRLKPWMDSIEQQSDGRIKFEAYPSMQLGGSPAQLFDQARDGVVDVVWSLTGYTPGRFTRAEVFELPFMTYDAAGASRAAWEFGTHQAADEFKDVHLLALHTYGACVFHTKSTPIATVADMKGLKMRGASRIGTQMLSMLGAVPVGMPLPQIPDALSKSVIDGVVLPWEIISSIKVDELAHYHSEFSANTPGMYTSMMVMVMNKKRYESLPADLQKVIDDNSGMNTSAEFGGMIQSFDEAARESVIKRGNKVNTIGDAEAQEFIKKSAGLADEWVDEVTKRGHDGKKLLADARALVEKYRPKA